MPATFQPIEIRPALPVIADELPLAASAMQAIGAAMDAGHPTVYAFSSGKDSSALVALALCTAARRLSDGLDVPPMLVMHSETLVENPEVTILAQGEMQRMEAFAERHGINLEIKVGEPALYSTWQVRVLGGRALPSFPNTHRDCSVELKVSVGERMQREVFGDLKGDAGQAQPVFMTGVRMGESAVRSASIAARGERSSQIWADEKGRLRLSPLLEWQADDVWEFLGYCQAGMYESYSDFADIMSFYEAAGGSSCVVVADMKMAEVAKQKGGCGARSGCWTCVRVSSDKSLEQMVEGDRRRYGYMEGLNRLRNFIANTQYDWGRRTFLGRTINDQGNVAIAPDVYSPAMLEELLRYCLTLQVREEEEAQREGVDPRFVIITYRELVAIDALWSLYGLHKPFHAIKIFLAVRDGERYEVPMIDPVKRTPTPNFGHLHVGEAWEHDRRSGDPVRDRMLSSGIRDPLMEMFSESCGHGVVRTKSGELVTHWPTAQMFDVDDYGAAAFVNSMAHEYIAQHHNDRADRTIAMQTYLRMGIVEPAHASLARWHEIARRTQWMQRHGLVGDVQLSRLLAMQAIQQHGGDAYDADLVGRVEQDMREIEKAYQDEWAAMTEQPPAPEPLLSMDSDGGVYAVPVTVDPGPAEWDVIGQQMELFSKVPVAYEQAMREASDDDDDEPAASERMVA